MSNNPMHKALAAPRCTLDQSGRGSPVVRQRCEVVAGVAECTAHAAARLKASGMAITGTAAGRRKYRGLKAH
jgi:hypothetical protein